MRWRAVEVVGKGVGGGSRRGSWQRSWCAGVEERGVVGRWRRKGPGVGTGTE